MNDKAALVVGIVIGAVAMWGVLYIIAVQKQQTVKTQLAQLQAAEPNNSAIPILQRLAGTTCACGGIQP